MIQCKHVKTIKKRMLFSTNSIIARDYTTSHIRRALVWSSMFLHGCSFDFIMIILTS
jgi:hypothetical protein